MAKNVSAGRLSFTLDLASAIEGADAVFLLRLEHQHGAAMVMQTSAM